MANNKPIFVNLSADDIAENTTEIESLCVNCYEKGSTRLLLTKIPHFKEIVLISFSCEHCGYENNEIQSGGTIADRGIRITLKAENSADLNRQVVKSDFTSVKIPEVQLEIPAKSQKGGVSTVEGLIDRSAIGLRQDQEQRRKEHPELADEIEKFVEKLIKLKNLDEPFTVILEDISGNSHIENPNAPKTDPKCEVKYFKRSKEQDHELGIYTQDEIDGAESEQDAAILKPIQEDEFTLADMESEVLQFRTNCNKCGSACETNMKVTKIPHFKEVVIMATNCDVCGNRTNEVKSGSGIEATGCRMEIGVRGKEDFSRDILKSETCSLSIPEMELEVGARTLGGRFTTVEGLLVAIKEQLTDKDQSHMAYGDSTDPDVKAKFEEFIRKFDEIIAGERKFTLILDDPAGNSYVQSLANDDEADENLKIEHYERSFEQNDDLGINDMKTENY